MALYVDEDQSLLTLKQDQAVNGEFTATEEFCIQNDIPFDRWSDHYCEYDAENAHFRPGMNSVQVMYADSNGKEVVCGKTVRAAMEKLNEVRFSRHAPITEQEHSSISEARSLLHAACPTLPENLQKFELVA